MVHGKKLFRAPEAALHFIGNEQHAVLVTDVNQNAKEFLGRNYESTFAQHWLSNNRRHFFRRDYSLESVFKMVRTKYIAGRILQRVREAVAIRIRNPIHIAGARRKYDHVSMSFNG